ncbi:hypothetical protein GCM10007167_28050 [Vulcaniibacterium thermophilum]|uniref:Secreted protein n=2 Tax=Vulcaniibacterium thermophilum TaxID=1169913 RepID=A0A918ZCX9_9GAMM|nr:hypothetical protein GCM10007167_28050 [Vulcaniibacterium thermophilum]
MRAYTAAQQPEGGLMRIILALALGAAAGTAHAQTVQCANLAAANAAAAVVEPAMAAPVAPELVAPAHPLGSPSGVLAQAYDEALSVDRVLLRLRIEGCQNVAKALPSAAPGAAPLASDPAAYKPQTQYDNTPWRFDMSQGGKRMTADEFDAWMKARGVRVAKGAPAATTPAPAPAPTPEKK